jgi:hypothetical protein
MYLKQYENGIFRNSHLKMNISYYIFRGIHIFFKFLKSQVLSRDSLEKAPG